MILSLLLLAAALGADTSKAPDNTDAVDASTPAPAWQREHWAAAGLPALNYTTDEGFGFGLIGSIYRYDGKTAPYKLGIDGLIFTTTKGVQQHSLAIDAVDLANDRLRLTTKWLFEVTVTDNYCGQGRDAPCDRVEATQVADTFGDTPKQREDLARRYYLYRYLDPSGFLNARWRLNPQGESEVVEVFGGWRGVVFAPGSLKENSPYPHSRYASDFPQGESGVLSVMQAGLSYDTRDNEPSPRSGVWVEASMRGASPAWGSAWSYVGLNTTLRGYLPLLPEGRLTFAGRGIYDQMIGEAPTRELATVGGLKPPNSFYGGLDAGRGVRQRRYVGRIKGMLQPELRHRLLSTRALGSQLDVGWLVFVDAGWIALDGSSDGKAALTPVLGEGTGLRLALDQNFIVRADVGFSAVEDYEPAIYLDINNLF